MTAQVSDSVELDGRSYSIAGVLGGPLFDPHELGFDPRPTTTANWRGCWCRYQVRDGRLVLVGVSMGAIGSISSRAGPR